MPSLARKILIRAANDGLILSPVGLPASDHHRHQTSRPQTRQPEGNLIIDYQGKQLSPYQAAAATAAAGVENAQLEAHGIVGTSARCSPTTIHQSADDDGAGTQAC